MTCFEGFLIPVPAGNREQFLEHASQINPMFIEHGARRVVECWEADLTPGKVTDFYRAVDRAEGEVVAFSWVEWPDSETRMAGMAAIEQGMADDPRWDPALSPIPFDGKRMVFGRFDGIVERGAAGGGKYVQGFVVPVPHGRKEDYRVMADEAWPIFQEYGATRHVEAWGYDVPHGKLTDFYRAVDAQPDEGIVFSFIDWPSRAICDEAAARMMEDERMEPKPGQTMPFDGKRMIWGGFEPIYELNA